MSQPRTRSPQPGRPRFRTAVMLPLLLACLHFPADGAPPDFEVVPFIGHFRNVERVVYSPDGHWLISSGDGSEGTSRVWLDARLRHVLQGTLATISPDGATVVTAVKGSRRRPGAIRQYKVATGELLWEAASPTVGSLAVTPRSPTKESPRWRFTPVGSGPPSATSTGESPCCSQGTSTR